VLIFDEFSNRPFTEARRSIVRRWFEDTRAPPNCNEFVSRRTARHRDMAANPAIFTLLSLQRLESPHAFRCSSGFAATIISDRAPPPWRFSVADLNVPDSLWG
jgi:hypothetical protein